MNEVTQLNTIDHIAFKVDCIASAVSWYVAKTGAKIEYQDETWAMLNVGEIKLALVLPGEHPNHFAIRCNSLDEFPVEENKLDTHRDGSQFVYLSDPYGNAIEWVFYPEKDCD